MFDEFRRTRTPHPLNHSWDGAASFSSLICFLSAISYFFIVNIMIIFMILVHVPLLPLFSYIRKLSHALVFSIHNYGHFPHPYNTTINYSKKYHEIYGAVNNHILGRGLKCPVIVKFSWPLLENTQNCCSPPFNCTAMP